MSRITEEAIRIARYRMSRKGIPLEVVDDFLHDGIVVFLEKDPDFKDEDKFSVGNWIGKVAFYKWHDSKYRLSARKTTQFPCDSDGEISDLYESEIDTPEENLITKDEVKEKEEIVDDIMQKCTDGQISLLHKIARGASVKCAANSECVTKQNMYIKLATIKKREVV